MLDTVHHSRSHCDTLWAMLRMDNDGMNRGVCCGMGLFQ